MKYPIITLLITSLFISSITYAAYDASTPPGGTKLTILGNASATAEQNAIFDAAWKFPEKNNAIITITINGTQEVWIICSPTTQYQKNKSVALCIGGYGNVATFFRTDLTGSDKALAFESLESGKTYCLKIDGSTITLSKGTTPNAPSLTLTDPLIKNLLYVGFSCGGQPGNVTFDSIAISPARPIAAETQQPTSTTDQQAATTDTKAKAKKEIPAVTILKKPTPPTPAIRSTEKRQRPVSQEKRQHRIP